VSAEELAVRLVADDEQPDVASRFDLLELLFGFALGAAAG
jgi:hypothetical protein